jgi:16S rRNA (guanine527-N7)-methyltransferase
VLETEPAVASFRAEGARGVEGPSFLDLGSGGGVPGLVLATSWPGATGVLVDSNRRRCALLEVSVATLGLADRLRVRCGRAETLARGAELRASFGLVVARSFGRPAVTAECAVGFLRAGGLLAVTEPPTDPAEREGGPARWPNDPLATLGLGPARFRRAGPTGVALMKKIGEPAERWPRSDGRPAKTPLW